MEQKDIVAIFNEMLTKVYSDQEQKYRKKKKYTLEHYCCSEEEKNQVSAMFEELLEMKENMDNDAFINILNRRED